MLTTDSLKRLLYGKPGPVLEEADEWKERLRVLGERVAEIAPGARVLRPGKDSGPLWLEVGPRAAIIAATDDGDLAEGTLRKMGLGAEQRRKIAALWSAWKTEEAAGT